MSETDSDELDEMERAAWEALQGLKGDYDRAAAPYIKILADIQSMRPKFMMCSVVMDRDSWSHDGCVVPIGRDAN